LGTPPYTQYFSKAENLTNNVDRFSYPIPFSQADTDNIRLEFHLGGITNAPNVYVDNVLLKEVNCIEPNPCEILENGNFSNDFSNWDDWSCTPNTTNNVCQVQQIDVVPDPWNAAVAYPNLTLIQGSTYTLSFKASAAANRTIFLKVGLGVEEWDSYLWREADLSNQTEQFNYIFTMNQATTNLGRISLVEQNCLQAANVGFNTTGACVENIHIETLDQSTFIRAGNTLSSNTQIDGVHNIHLSAGERVSLQSNFEVNEGATFTADVEGCGE